ncbi:YscO family type III secretion system apparatus protein, partial [Vibrio alginolyticus]
MIEQLLEIKKIRADRADTAVQQQEYRVNSSLSMRRKAEQSVVDYRQWRKEEEERRFSKAKQEMVVLKELEMLRQEIALLREREADLKQRAAEAKKTLEQETQRLKEIKKEALVA